MLITYPEQRFHRQVLNHSRMTVERHKRRGIDFDESAGIDFEFPLQAFDYVSEQWWLTRSAVTLF